MSALRKLVVAFTLKADTKKVKDFMAAIDKVKSSVTDLARWGAKLGAMYVAAGAAATAAAVSAANFAEEVLRSSSAFGIAVEKWQELSFAFGALGASQDDLADALSTITDRAVDAAEGGETYRKEFERVGIAVDELKNKNPAELLELWVARASEVEDVNAAVTSSVRLFGDDLGRRIGRALRTSGSSFKDYIKIINQVGGVFDKQMLERAQEAQIQFRLLGATFSTLRKRIGLELAPVFGEFAAKIVKWFAMNSRAVEEFIIKLRDGVARELKSLIKLIGDVDDFVQSTFGGWPELAQKVASAIAGIVVVITGMKVAAVIHAVAVAFGVLSVPMIVVAAKIILVAALIAGLVLTFEDLWHAINGGDSFIGRLINRLEDTESLLGGAFREVLKHTVDNFREFINEVKAFWKEHGPNITASLKGLIGVLGTLNLTAWIFFANLLIGIGRGVIWLTDKVLALMDALNVDGEDITKGLVSMLPGGIAAVGAMEGLDDAIQTGKVTEVDSGIADDGVNHFRRKFRAHQAAQQRAGSAAGNRAVAAASSAPSAAGPVRVDQRVTLRTGDIVANSEAGGRAAIRGMEAAIEESKTLDSLKSTFEVGDR